MLIYGFAPRAPTKNQRTVWRQIAEISREHRRYLAEKFSGRAGLINIFIKSNAAVLTRK
jgi:hypothetical protein